MEGISSAKEGMDPLAKYRNTLELESPRKTFWIARNKFYVIIKNMPLLLILKYLPEIIKDGILTSGLAHLIHTGYWRNFLAGLFAVIWNFPKFLKKRWRIQKKRKRSAKEIDSLIQACELERRRGFLAMCLPRSKIETDALISVIISHNGDEHALKRCLESVNHQDYENYEIVLVSSDPNGIDGSIQSASDMDEAIEKAKGTFVAVIDSEVTIETNWLSEMCETALGDEQAGMIGCKILEAESSLDSDSSQKENPKIQTIGWQICRNGDVHSLGNGEEDFRQHDALRQIFAPSRQAALFSVEMLNETRTFDHRLKQCAQTIDLGWRGRLMGWKALLSPGAVAVSSQNECNISLYDKFVIVLKNWTFLLILKHFWRLTFAGIWKPLFTRHGLTELPEILSRRRKIQNSRMIPKIEIEEWFKLL
jgi:GT2 family glycosyltransferase